MAARNGVGPYNFGPRLRGLLGFGRVYRSFNAMTGAPALLETATGETPHRRPTASVQVLVTAWAAPKAALAVEVQSGSPAALADVLDEAAELAEALPAAALGHLSAPHPLLRRRSRRTRTGHLVALAATVLLTLSPHSSVVSWEAPQASVPETLMLADVAGADWLAGIPMPSAPVEGQKRPPCESPEVRINGGCWLRLKDDAPCPRRSAEHKGGCYVPVKGDGPAPVAITP
ncbi:hypothetical protein [Myxococcus phage Mx4 ts27htf-1hrm-1]|nr:hypothetical protein [Myxococcus phage Mx4 ts27htf-1hrm-1]